MRVLVVDDEALVRHALRAFIADDERITLVGEAADGSEVVDACKQVQPDVVLSTVSGESNQALFDALVAAELAALPLLSLGAAEPEMKAFAEGLLKDVTDKPQQIENVINPK